MWAELRGDDSGAEAGEVDDAEHRLRVERELAELARLEAERAERERVAAEQRRRALEAGDALVVEWADKLAADKSEDGAFVAYEGLTQADPWGQQLRVSYTDPEQDRQTLEVRSAGPNGAFDDDDDILRTRTTEIDHGWWARNKLWVVIAFVWFGLGFVSAGGLARRRHRKQGRDDSLDGADVMLSLVYIAVAPLSMLFWLAVLIIEVIGEIAD